MLKKARRISLLCFFYILTAVLVVAMTQPGCKKPASKPTPNAPDDAKKTQGQSQLPAEPNSTTNPKVAESPTVSSALNNQAVPPAPNIKSLIDVIRAAKYWRPVREYIPFIHKEAPEFTITDINGKLHKLSDYRGKDVILMFWATWCPPCKMTIPHLMELRKTVGVDTLAIISLSYVSEYPPNTAKMISDFAAAKEINYTVVAVGSEGVGMPYDAVEGLPTFFFIDRQGKFKLVASNYMELQEFKAILEADWPEGTFGRSAD